MMGISTRNTKRKKTKMISISISDVVSKNRQHSARNRRKMLSISNLEVNVTKRRN
jgi:hypothetical protein